MDFPGEKFAAQEMRDSRELVRATDGISRVGGGDRERGGIGWSVEKAQQRVRINNVPRGGIGERRPPHSRQLRGKAPQDQGLTVKECGLSPKRVSEISDGGVRIGRSREGIKQK